MNKYTENEYEIFSRLFILNEFTEENLKKLSSLKIGIVGVGGIGCPLSLYLVNSGIKKMILVDGDSISKSNLNRQILFNINDIGQKKAKVAKERLNFINSNCKIDIFENNIDNENIESLSNCSLIVDASDNWQTSKLLNEFCIKNTINFLYASVIKHDIQVILFDNSEVQDHLCLSCIFPNNYDIDLPRCETVGISGIAAGIAGLIAAQKIINFSLNLSNERNILTLSDGKKLNIENINVKSKHKCDLKSIYGT